MSRKSLDETLEYFDQISRAKDPAQVCDAMLKSIKQFGFQNILAGTIPAPGSTPKQQVSNVILHRWPTSWSERYFSQGYLFMDPAIERVVSSNESFLWSELEPVCKRDPNAARIMNEAGDFRLNMGLTVPLVSLDGSIAGFSIAGPSVELSPQVCRTMPFLLAFAFGHTLNLTNRAQKAKEIRITLREREVLQWAADGKTKWEIGEILDISEHTVDKHLRYIREKLNVSSRAQIVAEAFRLNLII